MIIDVPDFPLFETTSPYYEYKNKVIGFQLRIFQSFESGSIIRQLVDLKLHLAI